MPADNADVGVDLAGDNIDEGGDCDCGRLCNRALPALVHGGAEAGAVAEQFSPVEQRQLCAWCRVATMPAPPTSPCAGACLTPPTATRPTTAATGGCTTYDCGFTAAAGQGEGRGGDQSAK